MATDIYNDRRQNFIKDEVTERAQHLNDAAHGYASFTLLFVEN